MKKIIFGLLVVFSFSLVIVNFTKAENCPLGVQKAYKTSDSSAVYYITKNCTKRAFNNSDVFFTYFTSWDSVISLGSGKLTDIANDNLGFMPWGPKYDPKYGALVKIVSDSKVYLLLGEEKNWINSEDVFKKLGYSWSWVEDIDERLLNNYKEGSEIKYTDHHPNYTLIKYEGDPKVYRLEPDAGDNTKQVKRWIESETVFNSLNFRWDRIVVLNNKEIYEDVDSVVQEIEETIEESAPVVAPVVVETPASSGGGAVAPPAPVEEPVVVVAPSSSEAVPVESAELSNGLKVENGSQIFLVTNKIIEVILHGNIDLSVASNVSNWEVGGLNPEAIYRFSAVLDADDHDLNGQNQADVVMEHHLYLNMPQVLEIDQIYKVESLGDLGTPYDYGGKNGEFLTGESFGPWYIKIGEDISGSAHAIKVNQAGYSADSGERYAYVGYWMGSGGALSLSDSLDYQVYNANTDALVKSGTSVNRGVDSLSEEVVHELNISSLSAGRYYIDVSGVGRSLIFRVGSGSAFDNFYTVARGLYHQRVGVSLDSGYTSWTHRLCHNIVYKTDVLEDFGEFFNANTDKSSSIMFEGGWYDAGDFDRRPMHLLVVQHLLSLQEIFPELPDNFLDLPESGNGLPDILDEALFGLKLWENLQEEDGGVRSGVESSQHPGFTGCWEDTLSYWTYAKNRFTSYKFATTAAQAARVLRMYPQVSTALSNAEDLEAKAILAWNWAEAQTELGTTSPVPRSDADKLFELNRERMSAAGELFALTEDVQYQDIFAEHWDTYRGPTYWANVYSFWGYANADNNNVDLVVQDAVIARIKNMAGEFSGFLNTNIYRTLVNPGYDIAWGSGTDALRNVVPQILAYHFEPKQDYINEVALSADFQLGTNPKGLSWVTGLGIHYPRYPLQLNSMYDGIAEPVPGLPVYGPSPREYNANCQPADNWQCLVYNNFYPTSAIIPRLYEYAPWSGMAGMNEFTVWQDMNYMTLAYGFLFAISDEQVRDLSSLTPTDYPLNGLE